MKQGGRYFKKCSIRTEMLVGGKIGAKPHASSNVYNKSRDCWFRLGDTVHGA